MIRIPLLIVLMAILSACNLSSGAVIEETPLPLVTATTAVPIASATLNSTATLAPTATATQQITTCIPRTDWQSYTIVSGDTLAGIARRAGTTLDLLVNGNCLSNPNLITVGQVLRVPNALAPATVTPTSAPQQSSCLFYPTATQFAYNDQNYIFPASPLTANQRYTVIGRNAFGYQIALPQGGSGWVQIPMGGTEGNGCGNVPQVAVSIFGAMAEPNYNVCFWVSETSQSTFFDQALTMSGDPTIPRRFYFVDGRSAALVRILPDGALPVWVNSASGQLDGSCGHVPDVSISTTNSAAVRTYTGPVGRFQFDYPGNWAVQFTADGLPGGLTGTISLYGNYPGAMGYPADVVAVRWLEHPVNTTEPAEQFARTLVEQIRAANGRVQVIRDVQAFMSEGGISGWSFQTAGVNAPTTTYIFSVEGNVTELSVQGNEGLALTVIRSLRPAP